MQADSLHLRHPRWAVIRDARRRQRRRLRRRAIVLAALAIGAGAWLTQRSDAGLQTGVTASTESAASADLGGSVIQTQAAGGRIWALTCVRACRASWSGADAEQLVEVDAGSVAVLRRIPLMDASSFAIARDGIWVAHFQSGDIDRLAPSGRVAVRVHLQLPRPIAPGDRHFLPTGLSVARGYLWVNAARGQLAEIDIREGKLVRMVRTPSEDNTTTTDRYGTWVAENLDGIGLLAPGAAHLRIRTIMQAGLPLDVESLFSAGRVVWAVADTYVYGSLARSMVLEVNARTDRIIRRVHVPAADGAVVRAGALFLGGLAHGHIYRLTPGGPLQTFNAEKVGAELRAASRGALWATTSTQPARLLRIRLPRG